MEYSGLPRQRGSFEHTRNHWWWRVGWATGTRYLTWHLTFEGATELHRTARRTGSALTVVESLDVVPPEWLHLTMTGVGHVRSLDAATITTHADAVLEAAAGLTATPLVFDRVFVYREGVCLSVDSPWVHELKALQADFVAEVGGAASDSSEQFHPHVSLAYFSGEVDERSLSVALDRAELSPVIVPTPRLSLIELGRDEHLYTWRVVAQRLLGA